MYSKKNLKIKYRLTENTNDCWLKKNKKRGLLSAFPNKNSTRTENFNVKKNKKKKKE